MGKPGTEGGGSRRVTARHDVGHQALASRAVITRDDCTRLHFRQLAEPHFDLTELYSEAADLDLLIRPPDKLQKANVVPANEISGAIQAARSGRIGNETLVIELGPTQVSTRHAPTADVELANVTWRDRPSVAVENVDRGIGNRPANRNRHRVGWQVVRDRVGRRECRALSRPVAIDQFRVGERCEGAPNVRRGKRLATGQQLTQPAQVGRIVVNDRVEERRCEPGARDPMRGNGLRQPEARGHAIEIECHAATVEQRSPQFERRGVKSERRRVQEARVGSELHVVDIADEPDDRAVFDLYAFGCSGRTRGVHDVGEIVRCGSFDRRGRRMMRSVVDEDRPRRERTERRPVGAARDERRRRCVADHERESFTRVVRSERQIGATGLEDRERCDDGVGRAMQGQTNRRVDGNPCFDQTYGKRVRPPIELGVGHFAVGPDKSELIGMGCDLFTEQPMNGRIAPIGHGDSSSTRRTTV